MADPLFSPSWHRVRDLKPRLRPHARIHRHHYRGEIWYVLQDPSNNRFMRFTPAANFVLGIMDGERTLDEIWRIAPEELGDDAPTQDEVIRLLGQLHASDVLQCDVPPDAAELFERGQKQERQQMKGRMMSPFSIKIPMLDPERFLSKTLPYVRPLLGWGGAALWLAVVLPAIVLAGVHWGELTENILDRVMTAQNLIVVWLVFPVLKVFHELGHGYAAKNYGGEVHEMGIMLLVFTPVPYVDASSSWALRNKYQRAFIGAAGMVVEVFLASIALYIWIAAEPGAVRVMAYNALLVGGVTTLLFNANPLLRFDGYYVFSDLIEIPNLGARANRFLGFLFERNVLRSREPERPHTAPGEPAWFVFYSIAAFLYRLTIFAAILIWILDQHFVAGVVLGAFAGVGWFGLPLWKGVKGLVSGPRMRGMRGRATAIVGAIAAGVVGLLLLVPVPLRTQAEGVIWIPEEALVRVSTEGFVESVVAKPGSRVRQGSLLFQLRDSVLEAESARLDGRVRELRARHAALRTEHRAEAQMTLDQLRYAQEGLEDARGRLAKLAIHSGGAGNFVVPRSEDLPGRFTAKGELLGYVLDGRMLVIRAVVPQSEVDLVRERTRAVEVRLAERLEETYIAQIRRIVPAASEHLPSMALGSAGGGAVVIDPSAPEGDLAAQSVFEVELELPADTPSVHGGGRVYVRFDHGNEPLAAQFYRQIRQLFLATLHV